MPVRGLVVACSGNEVDLNCIEPEQKLSVIKWRNLAFKMVILSLYAPIQW